MTAQRQASWMSLLLALLLISSVSSGAGPVVQSATPAAPSTTLKVGDTAPDFEVPDQNGKKVRLSDFKGKKNVVLAFYVLAFTGG